MLYIHVPYCKGKCIYCDFYSGSNPDWEKYLKAIASELSERIDELGGDCLSTIYIGGGTPSLIPENKFESLVTHIKQSLEVNGKKIDSDIEFTIEVNPEDVTEEKIKAWKRNGVNRISVGIQSLNDNELKFLKRRHNSDKVANSIALLKQYFNNISVDIIYGIPGQTINTLTETLKNLLEFTPQHISAYCLTYECRTPLTILKEQGKISALNEEDILKMEKLVNDILDQAGYERYEISNFALSGYRSRHNSGYWRNLPYLGLGPSASSYDGKDTRRTNNPDLKNYLNGITGFITEKLGKEERMEERIMLELRTKEGINLDKYKEDFGKKEFQKLLQASAKWRSNKNMELGEKWLSLTKKGISISDHIILDIISY